MIIMINISFLNTSPCLLDLFYQIQNEDCIGSGLTALDPSSIDHCSFLRAFENHLIRQDHECPTFRV